MLTGGGWTSVGSGYVDTVDAADINIASTLSGATSRRSKHCEEQSFLELRLKEYETNK